MISDKLLMQISLATAAIGLVALYILVSLSGYRHAAISSLKVGENVFVSGTISDYTESKGNIFFTLKNDSSVKVVMFSTNAERTLRLKLKDGTNASVKGKVQFYKNEIEIIAKEISND